MTDRICCFIHREKGMLRDGERCTKPAEWELRPSNVVYETVDSCTDHVGHLLDDAPQTTVTHIGLPRTMGGETGLRKMQ